MDSNIPENASTNNDNKGLIAVWQWVTQSNTRLTGFLMLGVAFVLLLGLVVIVTSQKSTKKKVETTIPQTSPAAGQPAQISQIPLPSPAPDLTKNWQSIDNINGFKLKYPPKSKILPSLNEAASSSHIQIIATDSATLTVWVSVKDKPLLDVVNLIRDKNKDQNILTKPISILYGGYEGYEWYFKGDKFTSLTQTLSIKDGKNRVIQFNKNNTHYIILSTFDDTGEQLLSTLRLSP